MKKIFPILLLLLSVNAMAKQKPMLMWFDATANFERLSNADSIDYYLQRIQKLGFTDVVVDLRPITGEVLYKSKIAPQMLEWNGIKRDPNFDFLSRFIKTSHKLKMKVHASLNMFVGGHNFFNRGIVYQDKKEWQSLNYTDSGMVPITQLKHKYSAMMNASNPEVHNYLISLLKEVVKMYPKLDGIIIDRGRYDGIESDFSEISKKEFEKYLGKKVENFPQDVYTYENKVRVPGKLYKEWLEFRVHNIYIFFDNAKKAVKKVNKKIIFGDYAGSWYPTYYDVGVNWASKKYDPSLEYDWATKNYKNFGYAELLDLFTTGNYYFEVTKDEVEKINEQTVNRSEAGQTKGKEYWYSVEGSVELVDKVVQKDVPVYAGLYVDQYKKDPAQFSKAVKMCLEKSDGLMVFDIVHIINNNWWSYLEEGLK